MYGKKFQLEQTNICKGVAICIMLFHHLFYNTDSWNLYVYKIQIGRWPLIAYLAVQGKICVTIFVLLSAYGLAFSYRKKKLKISLGGYSYVRGDLEFIFERIKKLYYLYWPVFVLGELIGLITSISNPVLIYKSVGEFIRDFFAVAYIIDGETPFNGAWWYISFALTMYTIFPLLYRLMDKAPKVTLIISFLCGVKQITNIPILIEWQRYLFVCCLGIFLAENDLLNKLIGWGKQWQRIFISGTVCGSLLLVRCIHAFTFDGFLAFGIIVFCTTILDSMTYFRGIFISLGKHSGTMFLVHGLLYMNFCREFIYEFNYPSLIFGVLVVLSFLLSVVIEELKRESYNICSGLLKNSVTVMRYKN